MRCGRPAVSRDDNIVAANQPPFVRVQFAPVCAGLLAEGGDQAATVSPAGIVVIVLMG